MTSLAPPTPPSCILTINGGSSSIKFARFAPGDPPLRELSGHIEKIGQPDSHLTARREGATAPEIRPISADNFEKATHTLIAYLQEKIGNDPLVGIGHRIVHGGAQLLEHQRITPALLTELRRTQPLDRAHLPREIALIEAFVKAFPAIPQFACFDTAFHRDLPAVARMFPIPRRYYERGIHRFGFHGLSYTYLLSQLKKIAGEVAANGRVILAHLGAGASMAAVHRQKPIDTTMAFTPLAGLMMATRPGDLDPGLLLYLLRSEKPSADQLDDLLSNRSGLLGVSDTSSDMQTLLKSRATDSRAAEAVDLFCYQARKQLAALTATLGGLETVIFSGGIGEHAAEIRAGICEGLGYLGIHLDAVANDEGGGIISTKESRVMVRVIPTDEEVVIAESVASILQRASRRE